MNRQQRRALDVPYILTGVVSPPQAKPKKTGIKTNPAKALVMTPIPHNFHTGAF